jgi:hypothetical protein
MVNLRAAANEQRLGGERHAVVVIALEKVCHYSVFRLLLLATSPPRHLANPTPMCAHPDSGCAHISVSGARAWKSAYKTLLKVRTFYHTLGTRRAYLPTRRAQLEFVRTSRAPSFFRPLLHMLCAEAAAAKAVPQKLHARHGERCANFENCGNMLITGRIHGKGMYCDAYACGPRGVAGRITKQRKAEKARKAQKVARPEKWSEDENAPPQPHPLPRQQRAATLAERPSRFLGTCFASALDRADLPPDTVMYRVEAAFQLGSLSQQRTQERWVTAAEVVTSLGRFASKYGEDAGIAVELSWAGPLCVQRETVQDSEEEAEDAAAAELSRTVSCGGG